MIRQLEEREKRALRRAKGTRARHSLDTPAPAMKKTRDYYAPVKAGYLPPKPRGRSHVAMGATSRVALSVKASKREAFLASIRAGV